jgi:hypothetical protein
MQNLIDLATTLNARDTKCRADFAHGPAVRLRRFIKNRFGSRLRRLRGAILVTRKSTYRSKRWELSKDISYPAIGPSTSLAT